LVEEVEMTGTFTTDTKIIECPNCKESVLIHRASFWGIGKKCPGCKRIIFYDWNGKKIKLATRAAAK